MTTPSRSTARRPILALVALGGASIVASIAVVLVTIAAWPAEAPPDAIAVVADAEGFAPTQGEAEVARPIARALREVPGVARVSTRSEHDRVIVTCELASGESWATMGDAIRAGIPTRDLPEGVSVSVRAHVLEPARAVLFTVRETESEQARVARTRLEPIEGVAEVELCGERERALRVELDPDRMALRGASVGEVLRALRDNDAVPAGQVQMGDRQLAIRTTGGRSAEELGPTVVRAEPSGVLVRLADLGSVEDGPTRPSCRAWRTGEGATIAGRVRMQGASATERVDARLRELPSARPFGAGARVTRGVVLVAPGTSSEERWRVVDAVGRALSSVSGVREVLLDEADPHAVPGSIRASIARDASASEPAATRAAVGSVPGALFLPDDALRVRVVGSDRAQDRELARRACKRLVREAGVLECVQMAGDAPELSVVIDDGRTGRYGISRDDITATLSALSDEGIAASSWQDRGEALEVRVHLRGVTLDALGISRVSVPGPNGTRIPLSELVRLEQTSAPTHLETVDETPAVTFAVWTDPGSSVDVGEVLGSALELPAGVRIELVRRR